jgi:mannose-6-phosphate isomerase-like protein (cupin superfamily)
MKTFKTGKLRGSFDVIGSSRSVQAAIMTLKPGGASSEQPDNEHANSEQWLFVLSGTGKASIRKLRGRSRQVRLAAGTLLLIEKGELHQIKNTGKRAFRSINFYAPPAYDAEDNAKSTKLRNVVAELVAAATNRK